MAHHPVKLLIALTLVFIAPIFGQKAEAANTKPVEVQKAEDYFARLNTVQARFVQTSADGRQQRGTFYLDRPGKLRFQYDAPNEDFVVADGLFIYFYDSQLKQQSHAPISETLAYFLLRDKMKLTGDLTVTKIMRSGDLVQISLVQTDQKESGTLVLGFTEDKSKNLELKKWRIIDAMGNITETELFNIKKDVKFKQKGLFAYHDPERKGLNQ
ncbi:MAG TPA: outer membrane lipoprotein carrier protein LolA [Alphaproteobacteria bacterium]|nr:outer membrane lipoprotein carrier protein LolA [Alphaproteobacteria bacterium]HOO50974.1 outer membrane lipoprotein carrier protein LolA [Alphaproteobacteria bacterium]